MAEPREHEIKEAVSHINAMVKYCYKNDIEVIIHLVTSSDVIEINLSPVQEIKIKRIK